MRSNRAIAIAAAAVLSGCIFSSRSGNNGGRDDMSHADVHHGDTSPSPDLGRDQGDTGGPGLPDVANDAGAQDMTTVDLGPPDVGPTPDMGDTGAPPDGGGTDAGVDMAPDDAPYEIVSRFSAILGAAPSSDAAAQVTMFRDGFLAGFWSDTNTASVGWFNEDRTTAVDSTSHAAGLPSFDLAGDATSGYAVMVSSDEQKMVRLVENPDAPDTLLEEVETFLASSDDVTYHEMSVAMEREYAYTAEIRRYSGSHLDIGIWGVGGYGTATDRLGYEIADVEIIGGASSPPNRHLLVAGRSEGNYALVDFFFNGTQWTNEALGCGTAPGATRTRRAIPLRDNLALVAAPTLGGTEWRIVACASGAATRLESVVVTPDLTGVVTDFDIAEETAPLNTPVVAWIQDGDVWLGTLAITTAAGAVTATVENAWQIPNTSALHVRAAYNTDRDTIALIVQSQTAADLLLLKRASP